MKLSACLQEDTPYIGMVFSGIDVWFCVVPRSALWSYLFCSCVVLSYNEICFSVTWFSIV
jgi:hypothetical protein